MRLFIAINFNSGTRSQLIALGNELQSRSKGGSFSMPENLHLTLHFLGECNSKQIENAKSSLSETDFMAFDISIDRIGRFKRDGGDIWWVAVSESKSLMNLRRDLSNKLTAAGFIIEDRKFSPHITLGRQVLTNAKPRAIEPFGEIVGKIDLMKSERLNGRLTYTEIHSKFAVI